VTEVGGVVAHAELDLGGGRLQLGEPDPEYHLVQAPGGEDDCYSLGYHCADADAVVARAEAAGATIRDPFGVRWSITTRVEDLSEQESARRIAERAARSSQE